MKKTYFLKFLIREIRVYSRISVWKPRFFPRQALPKILFVSNSRCTGDTPYRNWFGLKKFLIRRKRPIFKIRYSRNSQISYEILTFFPTQAIQKNLVASDSRCAGNTPYRVLFDLDKYLIRWKRPVLKFVIREIRKFPYEILIFFVHKLYQKILLIQTLVSQGILHTEIGSVWITSWPFQKDLFLKLFFGNNRKFPYETLTFFYASHCKNFFLF